jgi:hypothetical protein
MLFLWLISGFYLPERGFSALLLLGDKMVERALPEFVAAGPYAQADSYGYDGQYYAQLAVDPNVRNPDLAVAIDSLPYRARRILLSWTAWTIGGGDAARVVQVFSLQNVVCWLGLAALLLRWFPPTSWGNYVRWVGVLFCYGLCFSVRASLLDGPSLLAIAVGVMLFEKGRPWWAAVVLAGSGLIRETNIMTASLLAEPTRKSWTKWVGMVARGCLVLVPCVLWVLYLNRVFGPHDAGGSGNFDLPFKAYWRKIVVTGEDIGANGWNEANFSSVAMLVSLTVQGAFLAFRPQWSQPWWRVGAPYVVLMIALGEAVWDGYPGAASRALLPMALAFNALVPEGRRWWLVLLLGNASIFSAFGMFRLPADGYRLTASSPSISATNRERWKVSFDENWYVPERSRGEYWCWSRGTAAISIHNPHAFPISAEITGGLRSLNTRMVTIWRGEEDAWSGSVGKQRVEFVLSAVRLDPGTTQLRFESDRPPQTPGGPDARPLSFSLRELHIQVVGPMP